MISMTGFGRGDFEAQGRWFRVEVRSVNNRFLDLKIRLPWNDGELESRAVALVRGRVKRGRVEVSVVEQRGGRSTLPLSLDEGLARDLGQVLKRLAALAGVDVGTAARLLPPLKELAGTESGQLSTEETWPALQQGLQAALEGLSAMRGEEGRATAKDLAGHLEQLQERCQRIRALAADEPERARRRLEERLARLLGESAPIDSRRLAEEVALLADRSDINEELARLDSHLAQLGAMLNEPGEIGRRFEFMLQELHRELNTVAAKTSTTEISHLVVDAKGAVERMREQTQNLE